MGGLGELAAAFDRAADALERDGATRAARAAGGAFLGQLKANTPVLTGALRASESMTVTGGGSFASALISTHMPVYASFREHGGTITVKRARVLTDGRHFFGKSVTQEGSHYMERTRQWAAGGTLQGPVQTAIDRLLRDAGL